MDTHDTQGPEVKFRLHLPSIPDYLTVDATLISGHGNYGCIEQPTIPLTEIPTDSLSDLCDQYRAELFRRAGKADPKGQGLTNPR